ncbi:MAG TPA: M55 family metallopeptidase [Bacteroidota bacterium]|nr:M55 family metallopeptidase [Bacteroidota bacterium]
MRKSLLPVIPILTIVSLALAQPNKLKVYISVDMEGVVGTVTDDQLGPSGFEYQRYREFMTREALAAIEAAKEAGATEIQVSDSHGNGENLLIELLPKDVRIIRSWPRRFSMMAGIDQTFDAVIFIGYHASASSTQGVRAHTFSSARITRVALNGIDMPESVWNAAIAGHFGVPVIMISGDDAVIAETRKLLGPIEAAEVKKALGFHSANTLTPEASYSLIRQTVKKAIGRLKDFKPYLLKSPVTLDVSFKHYRVAEVLAYLNGVQRTGTHSIRYQGKDMLEIADFMVFLTNYSISLEP